VAASANDRFPLRKLAGAQPAANGFALEACFYADSELRVAKAIKFNDPFVALEPTLAPLLFSLRFQGRRSWPALQCGLDSIRRTLLMGRVKLMAPFFQRSLDSCGEIQEQVKPIGNLKRIRGTLLVCLDVFPTRL